MNTIPQDEVVVPSEAYKIVILEAKKAPSSKGRPMLTLGYEIRESKSFKFQYDGEGVDYDPNGMRGTLFLMLDEKGIAGLSAKTSVIAFHKAAGMTPVTLPIKEADFNADSYIGQQIYAVLYSEDRGRKSEITGQPMINPNTGKPIVSYDLKAVSFCPK